MFFKNRLTKGMPLSADGMDIGDAETYNKFISLTNDQKWEDAITLCNEMLKRWTVNGFGFSDIHRVYNNLGICCLQTGDVAEAERLFEMALDMQPDYQQARRNLDAIDKSDPVVLAYEFLMQKELGDGWRKKVAEDFKEREKHAWDKKKVEALSSDEIVEKLRSLAIETDADKFRALAGKHISAEGLAKKEWEPAFKATGWDEDFPWFAACELWRRWCPERPSFEMVEDEFGLVVDEIKRASMEKKYDKKAGKLNLKILETAKKFFASKNNEGRLTNKSLFDYWLKNSYWDAEGMLQDAIYELSNAGIYDEAIEGADFLFNITGDEKFLDQKAYVLCRSGNVAEGRGLYEELIRKNPDDFEFNYHAGLEFYSDDANASELERASSYFEKAHTIAKKDGKLDEIRPDLSADLADICKRLGDHSGAERWLRISASEKDELEKIEKLESEKAEMEFEKKAMCSSAFEYHRALKENRIAISPDLCEEEEEHPISAPVKSQKTGRNDPCPCGSGKKYKKCCLEKRESERSQIFNRRRLEDDLKQKLMDFAKKRIPASEIEMVFKDVMENFGADIEGHPKDAPEEYHADDIMSLEVFDYLIHTHEISDSKLTVLETFAKEMSSTLTEAELSILKEWLTNRYGLWEVQEVSRGEWLKAKDVFSDMTIRSAGEHTSNMLSMYDLFLGRVETLSGNGAFTGTGMTIPRRLREDVVEAISAASASAGYRSPSDFVHARPIHSKKIVSQVMEKEGKMSILDWDGYPAMDCHAVYDVKDMGKLEEWLASREDIEMTGEDGEKTNYALLQRGPSAGKPCENPDAVKDHGFRFGSELVDKSMGGKVRTISDMDVRGDRLEVFAISAERLGYTRLLLEKNLAGFLKFKSEEKKPFDLKNAGARKKGKKKEKVDDLPPKFKAKMEAKLMNDHYREWVNLPIRALDGATPKAALNDERLRPKLVELLKDMINMEKDRGGASVHTVFNELGIKPEDIGLKVG